MRPPTRRRASRTITRSPFSRSSRAAATPAAPAPTTTTSVLALLTRAMASSYARKNPATPGIAGFEDHKSGRPDLNRGPPAPKAGAIPGYATPRELGKLLYPAVGAQRAEQRAKCAAAMTAGGGVLDRRLGKGS